MRFIKSERVVRRFDLISCHIIRRDFFYLKISKSIEWSAMQFLLVRNLMPRWDHVE